MRSAGTWLGTDSIRSNKLQAHPQLTEIASQLGAWIVIPDTFQPSLCRAAALSSMPVEDLSPKNVLQGYLLLPDPY